MIYKTVVQLLHDSAFFDHLQGAIQHRKKTKMASCHTWATTFNLFIWWNVYGLWCWD